jgi:hypothetical protein
MRTFGTLILVIVGAGFILIRNWFARFLFSFVHSFAPFKERERIILKWIAVLAVIWGVALVILGVMLAMNLIWRD